MGWKPGGGRRAVALSVKIDASWWRASRALSSTGARGLAGDGCVRARVRSLAAAMARSVDDAMGMMCRVGNQARVSAMRSALVCQVQTR